MPLALLARADKVIEQPDSMSVFAASVDPRREVRDWHKPAVPLMSADPVANGRIADMVRRGQFGRE